MRMKLFVSVLFLMMMGGVANAQHIKVRIGFPVGISIGAPGRVPFAGAIWIGPEWAWRGGRYECVPGYWARPHHFGAIWIPGHWKTTRHGEIWIPGHWR